jgi:hypothetical protein
MVKVPAASHSLVLAPAPPQATALRRAGLLADLERRLRELGWDITITPTSGPFYWGAGNRAGTVRGVRVTSGGAIGH